MTSQRRYDPELVAAVGILPDVVEAYEDAANIAPIRAMPRTIPIGGPARDDVTSTVREVPGRVGDPDVTIRIFEPIDRNDVLRPGLVYLHGGGFMFGSVEETAGACEHFCAETDATVVSVEYRLAPEDPYPAAVEDCYAALQWFADNAEDLGVDRDRIAIAGGSAGAGLAAAVTLLARDRGGPALCFQLLQIPELDDRLDTPSMQAFTDTPLWNLPNARCSWRHYLGDLHLSEDVPYFAAPSRCEDLSGLPPAYISTMEFDPLRDEGLIYGMRLLQAGVPVELHSFPGTFHGSILISDAAVSMRELDEIVGVLQRALS